MTKHVAVYVRVSSKSQLTRSQEADLKRWANDQDQPVRWFTDKFSGRTMQRPAWKKLEDAIRAGKVSKLCCWRMDRLGHSVTGLASLFEELQERKVTLISLRDGVDLSTPAGRMLGHVLASIAAFETEVRAERQAAGIAAAKALGKRWGGSTAGKRKKVTNEQIDAIKHMVAQGYSKARIAAALRLSRPTIYSIVQQELAQTTASAG